MSRLTPAVVLVTATLGCAAFGAPLGASSGTASSAPRVGPLVATRKVTYHGGPVQIKQKIYLLLYGSQWFDSEGQLNDPDGEVEDLQALFNGLGGPLDHWSTTLTQYCQGTTKNATTCSKSAAHIAHPAKSQTLLAPELYRDTTSAAPDAPTESDIAKEALKLAVEVKNTSSSLNRPAQYWILTAPGDSPKDFGTSMCGRHGALNWSFGPIAYVWFPYQPEGGAYCGVGAVNPGDILDAVTMTASHEFAEAATNPTSGTKGNGGWYYQDNSHEIADKCVPSTGAVGANGGNITLSTGRFAVERLWSNNDGRAGGCVINYVSASKQH